MRSRSPALRSERPHSTIGSDFEREVYCLLGLPFDVVDMAAAVRQVREAAGQKTPCFLSTPNLNFLIACQTDGKFRESVVNSDLSIADGMPLVWIARLLGIPIRERVAGSDLFEQLGKCASTRLSVYFFGGMEGVAEAACQRLNAQPAGLVCVGYETPGFGSIKAMSRDESIEKINASGADFLVVSLGAKKGQAWIERNRARISTPVISHLGAVVNFVAGTVSRAPAWMQKTGLEWLWRIKEEPDLWRRYFGDGLALARLLATRVLPLAVYLRWRRPRGRDIERASIATVALPDGDSILRLRGAWTADNVDPLRAAFAALANADAGIRLDLRDVTYVDSAFIGLVMLLHGHAVRCGRYFAIEGTTDRVRWLFDLNCAGFLLFPRHPAPGHYVGTDLRTGIKGESGGSS